MLVNNYYNYLYELKNVTAGDANNKTGLMSTVKTVNNENLKYPRYYGQSITNGLTGMAELGIMYRHATLIVGTSDEPEDMTQINLVSPVTLSNISNSTIIYKENNPNRLKAKIILQGTNTTANPIIIKEVGICKRLYDLGNNSYTTYDNSYKFMFARTVLEQPITINPNETKTISVDWDIY